jgi:hypothetical protein
MGFRLRVYELRAYPTDSYSGCTGSHRGANYPASKAANEPAAYTADTSKAAKAQRRAARILVRSIKSLIALDCRTLSYLPV